MPKKKSKNTTTVTRIARIGSGRKQQLNRWKSEELDRIAFVLGALRSDLWNEYGSLKAWGIHKYEIDKTLRTNRSKYAVPAKVWEATLMDVVDDIHLAQASCIEKVLKHFGQSYCSFAKHKSFLQETLESREWMNHPKLSQVVRKYWYRGHTAVSNQIVIKAFDCQEDSKGRVWLRFGTLDSKRPLRLPTTIPFPVKCQLRLIKTCGKWNIHYTTDVLKPEPKTTGNVIGCDRGYTEVYATSSNDGGRLLGQNFGAIQTAETDYRTIKGSKRQKLWALARKAKASGDNAKADRIQQNNLGKIKWDRRELRFKGRIKTLVFTATLALMANALTVAYEDLTSVIKGRGRRSRRMKRNVNSWCKGVVADALTQISYRVGCLVVSVNCAYTSQLDSRYGVLLGNRVGDKFTGFDGVVMHSDINAADNVLARMRDREIPRFLKHTTAKKILLERTQKFKDSDCYLRANTRTDKRKALDTGNGQSKREYKALQFSLFDSV